MFFDVDGTLTQGSDFLPGAVDLVREVAASGALIALCSARPTVSLARVAEELGVIDYIAPFQAGLIFRHARDRWIRLAARSIPRSALADLRHVADATGCDLWVYDDCAWYANRLSLFAEREQGIVGMAAQSLDLLPDDAVLRKALLVSERSMNEIGPSVARLAALHSFHTSHSAPIYLEVTPLVPCSDKGLTEICVAAGVSRARTVAVGDSDNDRGMLATAKVGFAFAPLAYSIRAPGVVALSRTGFQGVALLRRLLLEALAEL